MLSPVEDSYAWIPNLPWRVTGSMQVVQMLLFLEGIHARPKAFVGIGNELLLRNQPMKRLINKVFPFLDVIEYLTPKNKEPAIDEISRAGNMRDFFDHPVGLKRHAMKAGCRSNSHKTGDLPARDKMVDLLRQDQIGQSIGIIGQKDIIIADKSSRLARAADLHWCSDRYRQK